MLFFFPIVFRSCQFRPRAQNAHAMLNAAFLFELETTDAKSAVKSCRICYGGVNPQFIHAEETEQYLTGVDDLYSNQIIQGAIACLRNDIHPDAVLPDPVPEYRQRLAIALFYRFCLNTIPFKDRVRLEFRSGAAAIERSISSGRQLFDTNRNLWPLTQPVLKNEALVQCSGEAQYSNDLFSHQSVGDELWCAFVQTTEFHEKIIKIDPSKALVNSQSIRQEYRSNLVFSIEFKLYNVCVFHRKSLVYIHFFRPKIFPEKIHLHVVICLEWLKMK